MSGYEVAQIGSPEQWRAHFGGFDAARSRDGRRVVDHELTMQFVGLTANALVPGEEAGGGGGGAGIRTRLSRNCMCSSTVVDRWVSTTTSSMSARERWSG